MGIFLIGLSFILWLDSRLLRKRDGILFQEIFHISLAMRRWIFGVLAMMFFASTGEAKFLFLSIIFLLPFYIIRRHKLTRQLQPTEDKEALKLVYASDALGVVVHWFFAVIVFNIFLESLFLLSWYSDKELLQILIVAIGSFGLLLFLIYQASKKFSSQGFWANVGFQSGKKPVQTIVVPALLGILFAYISVSFVLTRAVQPQTPLGAILEKTQSPMLFIFFIFLAIIVAPLVEEIIFRGYFFEALKRYKGKYFSLITVSLVFGLLHAGQYWGDGVAISMIILLGFMLTTLRSWTEDTRVSVVAHYAYNISVILIPAILSFVVWDGQSP